MTDDEVLAEALTDGSRWANARPGMRLHGGARGDDERWPGSLERRQALDWMRDRLRRENVFT